MTSTALAIREAGSLAVEVFGDNLQAIKNGVAPGLTDAEYDYLAAVERRTGLSLIGKQFYGIKRSFYNQETDRYEKALGIQMGIDGYRLIAERTGKYRGQVGPLWCGPDGVWVDVWLKSEYPAAAKVGVLHAEFDEPLWAVAVWDSYVQLKKDGKPVNLWQKMPDVMLAKCAESLAIRKGFPNETSGTHTEEEMGQADNERPEPTPTPIRARIAPPAAAPMAQRASNVHQHAQLRSLAEHGFPLSGFLGDLGLESIEELDIEQAKDLIVSGRAFTRNATGAPPPAPEPPAEAARPDLSFTLSPQQISLFWTAGATTGWPKEEKRKVLAQLYPRLAGPDGEVSIKSLSREQFDAVIGLFNEESELAYDKDGAAYLRPAGPPALTDQTETDF
jgi:phage recombination protein Bet